ncbi:MAG: hypothetical protein ACKVPX_03275 [Myxococcaceae bacterium]
MEVVPALWAFAAESAPPAPEARLFAPESSPEGCASGACVEASTHDVFSLDQWRAVVAHVRAASPRHGTALANGRFLGAAADGVRIGFTRDSHFHRAAVTSESGRPLCDAALRAAWSTPLRLIIEDAPAGAPPSLAEEETRARESREQGLTQSAHSHPAVRNVLRLLGGEVEHIQLNEAVASPRPGTLDDEVSSA